MPLSAPGDFVRVRIAHESRRFARAQIVELLEPGAERVPPVCEHFGDCGGCAWQHIDYAAQIRAKAAILREALVRIGGCELADCEIAPSPQPYRYRGRTRVLESGGQVGYRKLGSHALCAVRACPVLQEPVEAELLRLGRDPARAQVPAQTVEWEICAGRDGLVRVTRLATAGPAPSPAPAAAGVALEVAGEELRISPGTFSQANALLLERLVATVLRIVTEGMQDEPGERLVELFAGAGLFTLPLARRFRRVVAVEANSGAVADLRTNLARASLANVDVQEERVEAWLARDPLSRPDAVLLDPPRGGLEPGAVQGLLRLAAPRIVYLSCDPATLARDVALLGAGGYRMAQAHGFDLFPQTPHLEALVCLERESR